MHLHACKRMCHVPVEAKDRRWVSSSISPLYVLRQGHGLSLNPGLARGRISPPGVRMKAAATPAQLLWGSEPQS